MDKLLQEFIKSGENLEIDSGFYSYNNISKSIPFMRLGLDMLKKTYTNLQIYEDIIEMSKFTSDLPAISIHLDREKIDKLAKVINDFKNNRRGKYLVIYLGLFFDNSGHATVLFIQKNKNTVVMERYDPDYSLDTDQDLIDDYMSLLSIYLGVVYVPASRACPFIGPQKSSQDRFGYCQTYVLQYVRDRLMFALSTSDQIVNNTFEKLKNKKTFVKGLDNTIKSVMRYMFSTYKIPDDMRTLIMGFNNLSITRQNFVTEYLTSLRK